MVLNVPCLCYFEHYLSQISGTNEENNQLSENSKGFIDMNTDKQYRMIESKKKINRVKVPKCAECRINDRCSGIWEMYVRYYGDKEIRPVV